METGVRRAARSGDPQVDRGRVSPGGKGRKRASAQTDRPRPGAPREGRPVRPPRPPRISLSVWVWSAAAAAVIVMALVAVATLRVGG